MSRGAVGSRRIVLLLAAALGACDDGSDGGGGPELECGAGTVARDGECVSLTVFCGEGTRLEGELCVPVDSSTGLTCGAGTAAAGTECVLDAGACPAGTVLGEGACVLDATACGEGTTLDGALCVLDAAACADGTSLDDGSCVLAETACGTGTTLEGDGCVLADTACGTGTTLTAGVCAPDALACGPGTALVGGRCVLAEAACGTDTELAGQACIGTLACGEQTERIGDECVGTLYCDSGRGAVEIEGEDGVPVCVAPIYTEVSADTLAQRMAVAYCESRFRCCEADPFVVPDTRASVEDLLSPFIGESYCVKSLAIALEGIFALPDARDALAADPGAAVFDAELAARLADLFIADGGCGFNFDDAMLSSFAVRTDRYLPGLFQGARGPGEPCLVDLGCAPGLACRDANPFEDGDTRQCFPLSGESEPCEGLEDCEEGLYCSASACVPQLPEGAECAQNDSACADGMTCLFSESDGYHCYALEEAPAGYTCDRNEDCPSGTYCDTSASPYACLPLRGLGEACTRPSQCDAFCALAPGAETTTCTDVIDACDLSVFGSRPGRR